MTVERLQLVHRILSAACHLKLSPRIRAALIVVSAAAVVPLLVTNANAAAPTTKTFTSRAINVPITDGSTSQIFVDVRRDWTIADVNVQVRLNHTADQDLQISLFAPDGTLVALSQNYGGAGQNYGSGATNCKGAFTTFDDEASTPISAGSAPFVGAYIPDTPLLQLDGRQARGTWKLTVRDQLAGDEGGVDSHGAVYCWQLQISH
jgi:subtilisin-like proprotein convertase family protein